jgi:hypothetical protein
VGDEALLKRALRVAEPPAAAVSHQATASGLLLPDGPRQGRPYRWADDPVHRHVLTELDAGRWDSFALVGAVQTGKSLVAVLVPMLRQLVHQRRAVVYSQPTKAKIHEAWAGKVLPSIQGAGLGGWLPTDGQGARGGQTPSFVVCRDPETRARAGMLYLIPGGGASEGAQAAVSAPTVLVDEVDSFPSAHRVALVCKRADSFRSKAVRIMTSTVKKDGEPGATDGSIILGLYADSSRSRLWFRCPHCGHWQTLDWERVTYDPADESSAADSARITCEGCTVVLTEDDRQRMLTESRLVHHTQTVGPDGAILGAEPRTRRLGLLWTALDSTLRDLPTLAIEHWRATQALARGDHGLMRSFVRDQLCRPYRGDVVADDKPSILTRARIAALSEASIIHLDVNRTEEDGDSWHLSHVPEWVESMTVGVDVQRGGGRAPGRLYFLIFGRGGGRGSVIGWGSVVAAPAGREPTEEELHAALDRLQEGLDNWAPSAPFVRKGIDVGDRQDELMRWIKLHRDWWPVKGAGELKAMAGDHAGWIYRRDQDGFRLYLIEGATVRGRAQAEIMAGAVVGGIAMPHGIKRESALTRHLCGTVEYAPGKWSTTKKDAVHHPEWQSRIDYLDCLTYARALAYDWEHKPQTAAQPRVIRSQPSPSRDRCW